MSKVMNVGIMGYGVSTRTFHIPLILETEGVNLVAISSSEPDKIPKNIQGIKKYSSHTEMCADRNIDLIVIPTPNSTHHSLAKLALSSGKHVVIDKPFTINPDEAKELINIAKIRNLTLSVFHNRRWDGDFLTVKHLIENDTLGEIKYFESHFDRHIPTIEPNWRETDVPGSGSWYDLGSHLVDQTLVLFGQPDTLYVDCAKLREHAQAVDFFHAIMQYPTKRVILHSTMIGANPSPRFIIHGTKGSYTIYGMDPQSTQLKTGMLPTHPDFGLYSSDGDLTCIINGRIETFKYKTIKGQYNKFYNAVRHSILGSGNNPVTPESACQVIDILCNHQRWRMNLK